MSRSMLTLVPGPLCITCWEDQTLRFQGPVKGLHSTAQLSKREQLKMCGFLSALVSLRNGVKQRRGVIKGLPPLVFFSDFKGVS